MKLKDKVAIVTGAARGIGRGIALRLAKEGANLVVCDIDIEPLNKVADEIKALGVKVITIRTDVTKSGEVNQMVKTALGEFGKIDILVNNAGGSARERATLFCDSTEETWHFVIGRNLFGTLNCCQAVIGHMMERRSGKIVNMSSGASDGGAGLADYAAAKAGIVAFTKSLAREVANYGINVNVIRPGSIDTEGLRSIVIGGERLIDRLSKPIPGLRQIGQPEDVGNLVAFLVSDEASFISGRYYEMGCLR